MGNPSRAAAAASLPLLLLVAGCGASTVPGGGRRDLAVPGGTDAAVELGDAGVVDDLAFAGCDDQHACPGGKRCHDGACIPDNGPCSDDNDCQNDSWCFCAQGGGGDAGACLGGYCVPYPAAPRGDHDPDCQGQGFSAAAFQPPKLKCQWKGGNVIVTPLVVDLDGDGLSEIVFASYPASHPIAIRGKDCTEVWNKQNITLKGFTQLAAADLDGDKRPEIVAIAGNGVIVLDRDGNQLAAGAATTGTCSGPAIANVDNQGPPEIVVDGTVLRYIKGNAQLQVLFQKPATPAQWGNVSLFADLDGDGKPEVVTGLQVYDGVTGADKTPATLRGLQSPGAYPAVGDFNGDGKPDLVLVQSSSGKQKVTVIDFSNDKILFGPYTVADGGWGGTPTVADYDGDGVPDFGLASSNYYYVYALKCAKNPKPADCKGTDAGVLWQRKTKDQSSGGTGSSTFDFNGDGIAEVVYRDECWLRVMSGPEGKTLFAQTITSGTCLEYPVIADVDSDGHADLVVPSDNVQGGNCNGNPEGQTGATVQANTQGLFIFQDPMNRWMPSRKLWTSHTYHITEINEDYSVPTQEKASWKVHNTYRKNVQGMGNKPAPVPDYTGGQATGIDNMPSDCDRLWTLRANVCNRGTAMAPPGAPGAFYDADPRNGNPKPICTTLTMNALAPGECETVSCGWMNPPQQAVDLWFRADDDGMGKAPNPECKPKNNLFIQPGALCNKIG